MKIAMMALVLAVSTAQAHTTATEKFTNKPILADLSDLQALQIPVLASSPETGVGYALIDSEMQARLQERAHQVKKCGGFEDLSFDEEFQKNGIEASFQTMERAGRKEVLYSQGPLRALTMSPQANIQAAVNEVNDDNLRATVTWLSSFQTRDSRSGEPNRHVNEVQKRLETMLASSKIPWQIDQISHKSTKQNTLRVRLVGKDHPEEIIVLGAHMDSIASSWGGMGKTAPGADDNASGSANLIETLRILMNQPQPSRSVEFFWYAGEEQGLLGSAEVAKQYKAENKDVVAVLQLDMTLFPGAGEFVLGSMNDFTSSWLREYLQSMNGVYIKARIVDDKCGYGCSDHASWFRQGYPTLMPFEATFDDMNHNIHTPKDLITTESNFKHSAMFTKIALVIAMDLGNSSARQPLQ